MSAAHDVYSTGIYKAVEAAGGASLLAEKLKVSRQYVYLCLQKGYVPIKRAVQIEKLYGVPRQTLIDPDIASLVNTK